jgi:glutathione synthase/RimK-type ligase-like ATP-grasp enzyme
LTEINVTSPTGMQEMNALYGVRLQETVWDQVEKIQKPHKNFQKNIKTVER